MASVTRSNRQKSKTNALKFGGMRTTDTKPGRSVNPLETERPIGLFSSLKIELSVLITISTAIAFIMAWFLLKVGLSVWIAMPITLAVALGITYFFSRGLTSPLRQMRDAAEAMAEGDYTVRVHVDSNSRDEVGQLALTFNEMAEELQHADQMRRDMVANVSHELRTPVSALQAMVENMADGVIDPTPSNLESILNTTVLIEAHENKDFGTIVTNVVNFGSQIPQEARSDIFRRFVKGKTGPGTESGGTGLGLSIARWAAQLHGGSVRVVDDPRGADFEIILPKYHVTDDE